MMYLSQLTLNPASRMVQKEISNPYQLHRTLMGGFDTTRYTSNILYRLDLDPHRPPTLLVQSTTEPNWQPLHHMGQGRYLQATPPTPKWVDVQLPQNSIYRFRLRANPTVKKKREGKKHSNRVPLVREEKQVDWLKRKGTQHGFTLLRLQVSQDSKLWDTIRRPETKHRLTLHTVLYEGVLKITDPDNFHQAWIAGIGPAKAFGCGLLSLAPA